MLTVTSKWFYVGAFNLQVADGLQCQPGDNTRGRAGFPQNNLGAHLWPTGVGQTP